MRRSGFAKVAAILAFACCTPACQPTIDLAGTYSPTDFPWSGWPQIAIDTAFPSSQFTGTFTVYLFGYIEIPVAGTITGQNAIIFSPYNDDPPIGGLCICRGFDDGSSIFPGSGRTAGDGQGDRLACGTYLGQALDPPGELFNQD